MVDLSLMRPIALQVLAGTAILVLVAELAARGCRGTAWRRAIWQTAILGLLLQTGLLVSGLDRALHHVTQLGWQRAQQAVTAESPVDRATTQSPAEDRPPLLRGEGPFVLDASPGFVRLPAEPSTPALEDPLAEPPFTAWEPTSEHALQQAASTTMTTEERNVDTPGVPPGVLAAWPGRSIGSVVLGLWPAGTLAGFLFLLGNQLALWRAARRMQPVRNAFLLEKLVRLQAQMGLKRPVRLVRYEKIAGPVVFGMLRPTIALPRDFRRSFTSAQQDAILLHELAHILRRDALWQLLAAITCCVLWFHPLVYFARRRLRHSLEVSADEATLLMPNGPSILADCLVLLGSRLARCRRPLWLGADGTGFRSSLGRRVEHLLTVSHHTRMTTTTRHSRLAWLGLILLLPVSFLLGTTSAASLPPLDGDSAMSTVSRSIRHSLAAAFLATMLGPAVASGDGPEPPGDAQQPEDAPQKGEASGGYGGPLGGPTGFVAERDPKQSSPATASREDMLHQLKKLDQQIQRLRHRLQAEAETQAGEGAVTLKADVVRLAPMQGHVVIRGHRGTSAWGPSAAPLPAEHLVELRLHHLRQAIANLEAAGLHKHAHQIRNEIDRVRQEASEEAQQDKKARSAAQASPGAAPAAARVQLRGEALSPALKKSVVQLQQDMVEMRTQVEEMRMLLRQLVDQKGQSDMRGYGLPGGDAEFGSGRAGLGAPPRTEPAEGAAAPGKPPKAMSEAP